jgi:transcriptional regulator with XRE-family HTH domain
VTDDDTVPGAWEANFREHMQQLRSDKEMTQTDLARACGLRHQQIVARIESGERPIRLNEANIIAAVLGIDLATMMADPGSAKSAKLNRELARQQLTRCTAEITVLLDDGIEQFEQLTQELRNAWDAYVSAQNTLGAKVDKKHVHKGLAFTLSKFESGFARAREELASVIELSEV